MNTSAAPLGWSGWSGSPEPIWGPDQGLHEGCSPIPVLCVQATLYPMHPPQASCTASICAKAKDSAKEHCSSYSLAYSSLSPLSQRMSMLSLPTPALQACVHIGTHLCLLGSSTTLTYSWPLIFLSLPHPSQDSLKSPLNRPDSRVLLSASEKEATLVPAHLEVAKVPVCWCTGQHLLSFYFAWRERQSQRISEGLGAKGKILPSFSGSVKIGHL